MVDYSERSYHRHLLEAVFSRRLIRSRLLWSKKQATPPKDKDGKKKRKKIGREKVMVPKALADAFENVVTIALAGKSQTKPQFKRRLLRNFQYKINNVRHGLRTRASNALVNLYLLCFQAERSQYVYSDGEPYELQAEEEEEEQDEEEEVEEEEREENTPSDPESEPEFPALDAWMKKLKKKTRAPAASRQLSDRSTTTEEDYSMPDLYDDDDDDDMSVAKSRGLFNDCTAYRYKP